MPPPIRRRRPGRYLLLAAVVGLAGGVELEHRFGIRGQVVELVGPWVEEIGDLLGGLPSKTAERGETLAGRVVEIIDGDSLTLRTSAGFYEVRLHEVDAPEYDQPWGSRAEQALSGKVAGEDVRLQVEDIDSYGRSVGKLWLRGRDINRELVREGHAWVYRRYLEDRSLLRDERVAREREKGLWRRADPVPPWEWRRLKR